MLVSTLLHTPLPLATFGNIFGMDGLLILVLGILIFGRRLPEVGKNLGKTIVEFKKGLSGGYSKEDETAATPPEEETPVAPKRLSNADRVSVNSNLDSRPSVRKSLPQTEEV